MRTAELEEDEENRLCGDELIWSAASGTALSSSSLKASRNRPI